MGVEAWKTYETVFAAPPAAMGLTLLQWQKFDSYGDDYGVSMNLTP